MRRARKLAAIYAAYLFGYHVGRDEGVREGRRQVGEALAARRERYA